MLLGIEFLAAVSNEKRLTLKDIRHRLNEQGFPNLSQPRKIIYLHEIPKLGTGKTDYVQLNKLVNKEASPLQGI